MDTIQKLEQQADVLFGNIAGWENSTLQRIGKRIGKYGKLSAADIKALNNIALVNQDMDAITKELAKVTGLNISQIEKIYGGVISDQHAANQYLYDYRGKKFVPFAENKELQAIVRAYSKTTAETMVNLAKMSALNLGTVNKYGKFVPLQKFYTEALDKAVMQVASGATDFHTAMRDTIVSLGGNGMRVNYGSGITRRLDTVVRQSLLWGAKQASNEYNEMVGEELGCDGIEIDWHANPRPSHEFMQGKQYVLGKARTINGIHFESADEALLRLQDYGCLHFKTPILCGISEPRFSEAELKRLNAQNAKTYDIDGKQVSGYEATQMMRRLETGVREQKSIRDVAKASGDTLQVRRCNERIKAYQGKYDEISEITGIAKEKRRMSVVKSKNDLTSGGSRGTILSNGEVGELATPYPTDKIPEKIKNYINKMTEYGSTLQVDSPISFEEIGLLSRQTGTEFASITIGKKHYIVRGDATKTPLSLEVFSQKGVLNCHSHPYVGDIRPSLEDLKVAQGMTWQKEFYVVSPDGKYGTYSANGIIDVKDVNRSMTSEEGIKLYEELFKED